MKHQVHDQDAFGWQDEGRSSQACRSATARVLRAIWPFLLLWAALALAFGCSRAEAASSLLAVPSSAVPYLLLMAIALVTGAMLAGFFLGRATAPRPAAYCPSCAAINKASTAARDTVQEVRRVRAGAPSNCSYSSDHPERMLSNLHRRAHPPGGES